MNRHAPTVGIVGSAGAYGRWLTRFLRERMHLTVCGQDPADPDSRTAQELIDSCDVLIFSAPIRHTAAVIADYVALAGTRSPTQLWLDITSIKAEPVAAMLRSQAEVVGLHPMTAPPKAPTLKGRVMVSRDGGVRGTSAYMATLRRAIVECAGSQSGAGHARAARPHDGGRAGDGACKSSGAGGHLARIARGGRASCRDPAVPLGLVRDGSADDESDSVR